MKICKNNPIIDSDGSTRWFKDGQLHRDNDLPAVVNINGTKQWAINGKLHRENGPAVESAHGTKQWWINDELHRDNGPAIELSNGTKEWYLHGNQLTEQEFNQWLDKKNLNEKLQQSLEPKLISKRAKI